MLQQTQVATVIDYFQRFMATFPNIKSLALTSQDNVLALWTGLGYYSRARNLHETAKLVMEKHQGELPNTLDQLVELPGIGPSTAGAILSLGFRQSATILDGNVKRVLTRYFAFPGWPGQSKVHKELWQLAQQHTPAKDCHIYNQGLMDLGAMICTRTKPSCDDCPLNKSCLAKQQQTIDQFPEARPKQKPKPVRYCQLLIVKNTQGDVLLEKRPAPGIWGGLWSFPQCERTDMAEHYLLKNYQLRIDSCETVTEISHTFSHFRLIATVKLCQQTPNDPNVFNPRQRRWYQPGAAHPGGMPAPIVKLLNQLALFC